MVWAIGFDYLINLVVLKRTKKFLRECLSTLTTDATSKLDVFGHDGDTLGVDGAQVGVFEETNEVSLGSFLKSHHGRGLEAKVSLEILNDFTNQTLEGELADEELSALLVTTDLTESDGTRPVSVGLFDTTLAGADLRAALVESCLRGAFPPVDLRAVCLVRAITKRSFAERIQQKNKCGDEEIGKGG